MLGEISCSPAEISGYHNRQNQANTLLAGLGMRAGAEIIETARGKYEGAMAMANPPRRGLVDTSALADLGIRTSAEKFEASLGEYRPSMAGGSRQGRRSRKPRVESSREVVGGGEDATENSPSAATEETGS